VSERLEQPREQKKKKLTPAEIYRVAADIYERLPKGQELEVIEALCNMVGRTATVLPNIDELLSRLLHKVSY
jgi:hypothetical protein